MPALKIGVVSITSLSLGNEGSMCLMSKSRIFFIHNPFSTFVLGNLKYNVYELERYHDSNKNGVR